ncbi:MAG: DUF3298 domain-containing protein [Eubacterium sp.]|nr:DUF3298 domain-containing protein [Eubacterium sp.]
MNKKRFCMILASAMMMPCISGCSNKVEVVDESVSSIEMGEVLTESSKEVEKVTEEGTDVSNSRSHIFFNMGNYEMSYCSDDGTKLFEGSYSEVLFNKSTRADYPKVVESIEEFCNSSLKGTLEFRDEVLDQVKNETESDSGRHNPTRASKKSMEARRVDENVISFKNFLYIHFGGAHGEHGYGGVSFDTQTGEKIELRDIIKDKDALVKCVKDKLNRYYPDIQKIGEVDESFKDDSLDNINWCMDPEGITIFFNPYVIGTYADGVQAIPISFTENPEIFNDKYSKNEGDWALNGDNVYIDSDGNGIYERITVEEKRASDHVDGFNIFIDDQEYEVDLKGQSHSYVWIKRGDKYFLYVTTYDENNTSRLNVYSITPDDVQDVYSGEEGLKPSNLKYVFGEDVEGEIVGCISDPDRFYIGTKVQALSEYIGIRVAKVGDDGIPVPKDELYYKIDTFDNKKLTSKVPLELDKVDREENILGKETIPEGTKFTIYRTDNESFVDIRAEKGDFYRVYFDVNTNLQKINGMDIEEVFDGIRF